MTHHWGYVSAVLSSVLFGISSTFNKIAIENINPTIAAGLIYLVGGVVLFLLHLSPVCNRILSMFGTSETEAKITRRDLLILGAVIACGSVTAPLLLLNGLNITTATNASLLLNAESLFTVLIALSFLKERCSKGEYIGIFMLLAGVIFLTTNGNFGQLTLLDRITGNVLIIGACLFWGIDNNLSKFLSKKRDILLLTGSKCFIGGSVLLTASVLVGISLNIPLNALPYILSVGALSIALSVLLFLFALRKIGSMRTGIIFATSSLFGAVLAFLVLGESITIIQLAAGTVMLAGVYVIYRLCGPTKIEA